MTVCPSNDYAEGMDPTLRYRFSECARCGARTLTEAGRKCRPYMDITGEYECPSDGEGYFADTFDRKGRHVTVTNASRDAAIAIMLAVMREMVEEELAAEAAKLAAKGDAS